MPGTPTRHRAARSPDPATGPALESGPPVASPCAFRPGASRSEESVCEATGRIPPVAGRVKSFSGNL
ncbi:hypothetical protein FRUB_03295 [Fimbriiglobus ruber]|uniref:Uncharacterized protein n=1 Tax=Fimbriiglobus ruber TaxID=1908690 RepID=A0A225E113_9BACT|nr:hypothetical protein FRUB_03295 [Fimbriiglobus ruber]